MAIIKADKTKLKDGILKTIGRLSVAEYKKYGKYHGAQLHIATALCICCFIDAMGKYIYGGQADECKFRRFIEKYMPNLYKNLMDKAIREKQKDREKYLSQFYKDVRCGLVHEYFPKSKAEIISSKNCPGIIFGNREELKVCLPKLKEEWETGFKKSLNDV